MYACILIRLWITAYNNLQCDYKNPSYKNPSYEYIHSYLAGWPFPRRCGSLGTWHQICHCRRNRDGEKEEVSHLLQTYLLLWCTQTTAERSVKESNEIQTVHPRQTNEHCNPSAVLPVSLHLFRAVQRFKRNTVLFLHTIKAFITGRILWKSLLRKQTKRWLCLST